LGRWRDIEKDQKEEIRRLSRLGWSYNRIAKKLGIGKTTVGRVVQDGKVEDELRKVGEYVRIGRVKLSGKKLNELRARTLGKWKEEP